MVDIFVYDEKLEKFKKADVIEIIPMHDTTWSIVARVDGERVEAVALATGIDTCEDESLFVEELIKAYPCLENKSFEY